MSVNKGKIDYSDFADAASAFITMLFMVTTFSIAEGISDGIPWQMSCLISSIVMVQICQAKITETDKKVF